MNLHDVLLTIQYITISVLFLELVIVFSRWKNSIHSYLLLTIAVSFLNNLGYLFQMKATSEEAYIVALKFSYLGRVWIVFAFLMFTAKMCRVRFQRVPVVILLLAHVGVTLSILSIGKNDLYYRDYRFVYDSMFPQFYHTNGVVHDFLIGMDAVLVVMAFAWVVKEYRNENSKTSKQRLLMLLMASGTEAVFFMLHVKDFFGVSKYYDLTMLGALFGTIFMLVGIIGFDLMGTREIAKNFAIDRISEGIIAVDNAGHIQYYNESAARIYPEFDAFFSTKEECAERLSFRAGKLIEKKDVEKNDLPSHIHTPYDILSIIDNAVKKGETLKIGDRIYTPEENELQYDGECYGKLYALMDDTEHYQYMEELQVQRDIADHANEAKSKFLANMSHEIRTPINAMLGMDEMILRESNEKPIRSYAGDIMSAGRTLLSLINDILDLSKIEEGKMEIIPVQYDLFSLINDLVNMTRDRASKKGLKFNVKADEHIPHLLVGDEIRIRQCATNLLTNAVKYTEKGEVTITFGYDKKDEDHIHLVITVEDTGIGMKEEDMANLFSPYKRIEEKRNRAIEGTGLGMSITRQLLDLMGTSLEVHSEYGKGSVFTFAVEQEVVKWEELGDYSGRFEENIESSYEYHELFHAPEARILVVDDTEINLTVIQNLLKKTGIKIDTAISGKIALGLCADNRYDVVFIDHMMPEMDGIETLKHMREDGLCKDVPAVSLTANAVSGAREMFLEAGFTDYLSKPVDGRKLEKMLYDLLPKDKILSPDESFDAVEDVSSDSADTILPGWLDDIDEIDVGAGVSNCGSEEGYLSVLTVFHQTAPMKADEIKEYFDNEEYENYTVKVHALKSSARIIGASALSELAKSLEEAGKSSDTGFIKDNTDRLLSMYRSLDDKLKQFDVSGTELPVIDEGKLKEAYQTIIEIAGCMDYGMMDDILKDLKGYGMSDNDRQRIDSMEIMLSELNWDGIVQAANEGV